MAEFSIRPGQQVKPLRVWGLGSIIGDRQKTVTCPADYADEDRFDALYGGWEADAL